METCSRFQFGSTARLEDARLERCFDVFWPSLEKQLGDLPKAQGELPKPSVEEMFVQIMQMIRSGQHDNRGSDQSRKIVGLERLRLSAAKWGLGPRRTEDFEKYFLAMKPDDKEIRFIHDGAEFSISSIGDIQVHSRVY